MSKLIQAEDLKTGDWIKIGGMLCEVTDAEIRFISDITIKCYPIGSSRRHDITIEMPKGLPMKTHNQE